MNNLTIPLKPAGLYTHHFSFLTFVSLFFLFPTAVSAQGFLEKVTDFFEFDLRQPPPDADSTYFTPKVVLAPIVYFEPSTSLGLGIGAKLLFKPKGAGPETRTSNLPVSLTYTLKNQLIFYSGYTVFFPEERWLLRGNLGYQDFPIKYYRRGPRSEDADLEEIEYQQVLIEPLLLRRVADTKVFIGGGFRYNNYYGLGFQQTVDEGSTDFPVGSLASTSVGLETAVTVDSRDNVLNALRGDFLEITHGVYGEVLGGTHEFMLTKADYRNYIQTGGKPNNVLAYQTYARYAWDGSPELEQSSLGGGEFLRGFDDFRWRDRLAFFAQAEYRWQTWDKIGFVFFAGAGDVAASLDEVQLNTMKFSVGTGLRLKIVESENLNVRIDYGVGLGRGHDRGVYLGIAEAF